MAGRNEKAPEVRGPMQTALHLFLEASSNCKDKKCEMCGNQVQQQKDP